MTRSRAGMRSPVDRRSSLVVAVWANDRRFKGPRRHSPSTPLASRSGSAREGLGLSVLASRRFGFASGPLGNPHHYTLTTAYDGYAKRNVVVRWNPCSTITYRVNASRGGKGARAMREPRWRDWRPQAACVCSISARPATSRPANRPRSLATRSCIRSGRPVCAYRGRSSDRVGSAGTRRRTLLIAQQLRRGRRRWLRIPMELDATPSDHLRLRDHP